MSAARDELAAALSDDVLVPVERGPVLDALLPVVDRIAAKRAAEELRAVLRIVSVNWPSAQALIRVRLDALDGNP